MIVRKGSFVSFEPIEGGFRAFLSLEDALSQEKELDTLLSNATQIYDHAINEMRFLIEEMKIDRTNHKTISARRVWQLGDIIFKLIERLNRKNLEIDGVYDHLCRDLKAKRKWLEKVIILRRYLPTKELIPKELSWGRCEKGTRRKAERLKLGLPLI